MKTKVVVLILSLALLISFSVSTGLAQEKQTISVLIQPTLYEATGGDGGLIQRFQEETGIEVTMVSAPTQDLRDKALMEFISQSGRFDVVFLLSGWLNEDMVPILGTFG